MRTKGFACTGILLSVAVAVALIPRVNAILLRRFDACNRVPKVHDAVALTFDDGPDERFTPQILDILVERDVQATFFVVGENCERNPELVKRIIAEGHEIASHSHTHGRVTGMDDEELAWEFDESLRTLRGLGVEPAWYRPPHGALNVAGKRLAAQHGLKVALWSRSVERSRFDSAEEVAATLIAEARGGDILLSHDGRTDRSMTVEALPGILDGLHGRGFDVVTLSELDATKRARRRMEPQIDVVRNLKEELE